MYVYSHFDFGFGQKGLFMSYEEMIAKQFGAENVKGYEGPIMTVELWNQMAIYQYFLYKELIKSGPTFRNSLDEFDIANKYACQLEHATILIGLIDPGDGKKVAHFIIKKGEWVFDPAYKLHVKKEAYEQFFKFKKYTEVEPQRNFVSPFFNRLVFEGYEHWCKLNDAALEYNF